MHHRLAQCSAGGAGKLLGKFGLSKPGQPSGLRHHHDFVSRDVLKKIIHLLDT